MARTRETVTPETGEWYLDPESQEKFKVVDVDEENGGIEIQYFDGTIGELARDEWGERALIGIEAPEDWTVSLEPVEEGDINYDQESYERPPMHTPLPGFEQDEVLQAEEANPHEEIPGSDAED